MTTVLRNTVIFLIGIIFLYTIAPASAYTSNHAKDKSHYSENTCGDFLTGVHKIIVAYDQKMPASSAEWDEVMRIVTKASTNILKAGDITLTTSQVSLSLDTIADDDLYVKIYYSFARKDSFSHPLPNDLVVTWAEYARKYKTEDGESHIAVKQSGPRYRSYDSELMTTATDKTKAANMHMATMPVGLLENISCDVLRFSAKKICTDREKLFNNKIVPDPSPCKN